MVPQRARSAYFRSLIEMIERERGSLCEVCGIGTRCAGAALSRCLACLKARVDAHRRDREARAASAGVAMPGNTNTNTNTKAKACAACKTVKPLTAFARHARSRGGHCDDCRDCANARAAAALLIERIASSSPARIQVCADEPPCPGALRITHGQRSTRAAC
jgi:hypothetical protein